MADDDPVFREELTDLLQEEGHQVVAVPSAAKAEEILDADEYDVLLTDLRMPRKGGMDLLRTVRSRWPRTLVVVVTGYASVDTALEAMKLGAFDYVRKPFRIEQVQETLRLAAQEHEFEAPEGTDRDPEREARTLAATGRLDVLYIGGGRVEPAPRLTVVPIASLQPADLVPLVDGFITQHPGGAVVLSGVEDWVAAHRLETIVELVDRLRTRLAGHGPLRVGFNPARLGAPAARALGAAVAADETHATLEALANPIRRKILERLAESPATFGETMRAAHLDDSPKISFHLRRLSDSGLVLHEGDTYRLSTRGEASVRLLADATFLPAAETSGNRAFPERSRSG